MTLSSTLRISKNTIQLSKLSTVTSQWNTRRSMSGKSNHTEYLRNVLNDLSEKRIDFAKAISILEPLIKTDIVGNFAKIDTARARRTGFPEVVYGKGKSPKQLRAILERMIHRRSIDANVVVYSEDSIQQHKSKCIGTVAVLCAGTSDVFVAEECCILLDLSNVRVERHYDVGVAGLHRLLSAVPSVEESHCAICIAGMDGAMPSVVAGLVPCPVIAVPTSVGYGAVLNGIAPLLTMLNACAPGVSVVNIDNGFGAAAMAVKILNARLR